MIRDGKEQSISTKELVLGDLVKIGAGEQIPADLQVISGRAEANEALLTGESDLIVKEAGAELLSGSFLTSGSVMAEVIRVGADNYAVRLTSEAKTHKAIHSELVDSIRKVSKFTSFVIIPLGIILFLEALFIRDASIKISVIASAAALLGMLPKGLVLLISIALTTGVTKLAKKRILVQDMYSIETLAHVDTLCLDKTGTITLGNRRASEFLPVPGVTAKELADAAQLASFADETAEGRSIVILAKEAFNIREREFQQADVHWIDFSAKTRMSGIDYRGDEIRKGAADTIKQYVTAKGQTYPTACDEIVEKVAKAGGTPLVVVKNGQVLGVVYLKDIVKNGVKEKFADMRKMGIKTIMITGDNPLTAAAIAAEAGVDDFLAEATPENKMNLIREYQEKGHLVAMTGDGTNDAPALAQADVAMAMNTGTQAAKEAGNMIDLDSSPTKLLQVVQIGKQLLMTRGALTTFSIANDIAKYFAVIPVLFYAIYPELAALNIMNFGSPLTAILSAVIYNAVVIIALIPLALKGVKYQEKPASQMLRHNLVVYGLGGIIAPFICIKLVDLLLSAVIL